MTNHGIRDRIKVTVKARKVLARILKLAMEEVEGFILTIEERLRLKRSIWKHEEELHEILEKKKMLENPFQSESAITCVFGKAILKSLTSVQINYEGLCASKPVHFTLLDQYTLKIIVKQERIV